MVQEEFHFILKGTEKAVIAKIITHYRQMYAN